MMVTIMEFGYLIDGQLLREIFDGYPCDSIKYCVDESNHSYVKIYDSESVTFFPIYFMNWLYKHFECKDLKITVTYEKEEG